MTLNLEALKSKAFHDKPHQKEVVAQRKQNKKALKSIVVDADYLGDVPLFETLEEVTRQKIQSRIQHGAYDRGKVLYQGPPMEEEFSPIYFVLYGDISIHRSVRDPQTHVVTEEVSNYLSVGELYIQKLHQTEGCTELRVEALCPTRVLSFTYQELNYLLSKSEVFRDRVSTLIRESTSRQTSRFNNEFQKEIAAFFVKERLTFAQRVKIKRMDICIECDGCYTACKDRHGTDRLGASEVKYGITEIPNNCHNCAVPECIDKCNYGTINKDETTGEIVISDNCFGCGACSSGCSFNAIQMHPTETLDLDRYFPNRDPDHPNKMKKIAQKCDNCAGYADQACVTACPTGALFQVDGPDLFNFWEQFNVHKNPGFDAVISPEDSANRARPWWIAFTLLNFIFLTYECLTRVWAPEFALGHVLFQWGLKAEDLVPDKALHSGGTEFGHALGYIGTACMMVTQLYTPARKLAPRFGSVQSWFEVHIWFGFLGFIYGFYHTAFHWREPIAVTTFTLFTIVIITGVLGRYLVFHIPRNQAGKELAKREIEDRLQALNQEIELLFQDRREGYSVLMEVLKSSERAGEEMQNKKKKGGELDPQEGEDVYGLWPTLSYLKSLMAEWRRRNQAIEALRPEITAQARDGQGDLLIDLIKEKAKLSQSATRARLLSRALKSYRIFHVSIGHLTFIVLTLHIVHGLTR